MLRNLTSAITGGWAIFIALLPLGLAGQPFVDGCFNSPTVGTSFSSNANIFNNNADLLSWTGSAWTGAWPGANITLNPASAVGTRAIWSGDGTVWTTGGEGFGLRLTSPLVNGTTYSFAFNRASHGTGQNGNFQPTLYSNAGGSFGTMIGAIPGVGTAWTTNNITFTASAANNGHTWLYFHNSTGSGLFLGCTVILPMALKDLAAIQFGDEVHVEWHVQDEPDYVWHVVERSFDAEAFEEVGRVASVQALEQGHDYRFADASTDGLAGNLRYYRIRSVNQEGLEAFSPVTAVQLVGPENFHVQVYPQPVAGGMDVTASHYATASGEASYMVLDLSGRLVQAGTWATKVGKNEARLNTASLHPGTYLLEVRSSDGRARSKFVVLD